MSKPEVKMPTASSPNRPRVGAAEYARWYVMKRIADQLPADAHQKLLDLVIQVRTARGMYQEYADMLSQVVIDPEGYEEFLAPGVVATLKKGARENLRLLIIKEANSYNADLTRTLKFLADAMSRIDETDESFMKKLDERIFSYGGDTTT